MKKLFFLIMLSLFPAAQACADGDVLVIQSLAIKPYNQALQGFKSACEHKSQKFISSELNENDLQGKVRKLKPGLILAIGQDALVKVRGIRDVPIVYLMVLNPQAFVKESDNITGVSMNIAPERQLAQLRQVLPHARKIGILFDPVKSGVFVGKSRVAAVPKDIELVTKAVQSSREAVAAIDGMKGKVDALWLLPDTTVVNPATIDLLLLSTIENRIPVLIFSEKYAEKGALMSLAIDPVEAGNRALAGENVNKIKEEDARGSIMSINLIVAKKLGITMSGNVLKQARVIR
jgi:putative tryptophan/tyrosine transport system substrate-binding protein